MKVPSILSLPLFVSPHLTKSSTIEHQYNFDETSVQYTTPDSDGWPSDSTFYNELGLFLSPEAELFNHRDVKVSSNYTNLCRADDDGLNFMYGGQGLCMMNSICAYQFCNEDGKGESNLPAYSVKVKTADDISVAVQFANRYNIPISIKTTGHNFSGSSIIKDSINIWMANYPKDGTIKENYVDSCGESYPTVIGINGGELWNDVFEAIGPDYHVVSGDTRSVSAAGGWLQGVGLSQTSRYYGLGIDNVVSFDVVLANGKQVTADGCTNPDLFWALRGGGGGTYGVVTHVEYKLYPTVEFTEVIIIIDNWKRGAMRKWLRWWAEKSPNLDNRLCGSWFTPYSASVFAVGDEHTPYTEDFIKEVEDFLYLEDIGNVYIDTYDSWYDLIDDEGFSNSDEFGDMEFPSTTRLVSRTMLQNDAEGVVDLLMDLPEIYGDWWGAYWLGGKANDVDPNTTAVHPVMREALWSISCFTDEGKRAFRNYFTDDISAVSFNHQGVGEPNWRRALWGDDHYHRLLGIKNKYDPERRFNCWHCVGYQGPEFEDD